MNRNPDYTVVFGQRNAGKTTLLRQMAETALREGRQAGGFLSVPFPRTGKRGGYGIFDLVHHRYHRYAWRRPGQASEKGGFCYHLDEEVFQEIRKGLQNHLHRGLLLIDEFGPLERSEGGLCPDG